MPASTSNTSLVDFSNQLAGAVEHAAQSVVAVHARPRLASSGVHWRAGLILTTDATVRRDTGIQVTLPDGRKVAATVQGRDARSDLAVLRIAEHKLATAEIGDPATMRPGHIALALARLDDSGPRVSFGAVSSVGGRWRTWKGGEYDRRLQSGLALYPGFGGGPLVDAAGRVHGINSGGLSRHFTTTIPVETIERILGHLTTTGYVPRPWLGVAMQPVHLTASLRQKLGLVREGGLLIMSVEHDGPASKGGILVGDVVLAVGGTDVAVPEDVLNAVATQAVGSTIGFDVVRGGRREHVELTVGARGSHG